MKYSYKISCYCIALILSQHIDVCYAQKEKAYQHLYDIMDQYHKTIDVYTDQNAGGNSYYPSFIGNYNALTMDMDNNRSPQSGWSCIEIQYNPTSPPDIDWAGIQWLFPDTNWGYWQGRDLTGSDRLSFWAKGETGKEKVEFKLGGVNRSPFHNPNIPYQDSFDLLSTGILTLSDQWQKYHVALTDTNFFSIYLDGNSGSNNRYFSSGWYNGDFNMIVDPSWPENPHSGRSCFKVEWTGFTGLDGYKWNGIIWQFPEGNLGSEDGYDLSGATKLTFWARTDEVGLKIKFFVGIDGKDSCGEVAIDSVWRTLYSNWTKYEIDLTDKDLSNVRGGFGFVFNDVNDPDPDGCIFYLDDVQFDLPLSNDLSNLIGGFVCSISESDNPNGCTFYLDNIQYELSESAKSERLKTSHFLRSYVPLPDTSDNIFRNTAYIYDNALAMLAFMANGTPEDWQRAEVLGRSFIYCQENDRDFNGQYLDYRLRNAYRAGDLADPLTGFTLLPSTTDEFNASTHSGNMAWAMIAMLTYYEQQKDEDFLFSAKKIGEWIFQCIDSTSLKGYFGGYEGYGHSRVFWKSIEHNIDIYVAFKKLYDITKDQVWFDRAEHAKHFIEAMWNENGPYFWIGTKDSANINDSTLVEDAQSWAIMALKDPQYLGAIDWTKNNLRLSHHGFDGFDFNTDLDGIWFEGTAHMAISFLMIGDNENYDFYMNQLRSAQVNASNGDSCGIVAACHDGVSTGLNWGYFNRLHVGATAWYIFAEKQWNPYWNDTVKPIVANRDDNQKINKIQLRIELLPNYPNPFNHSTIIRFNLPKADHVILKIYSITGQLVATLFNGRKPAGTHEIVWGGKNGTINSIASGIYIVHLENSTDLMLRKIVLIK